MLKCPLNNVPRTILYKLFEQLNLQNKGYENLQSARGLGQ